MHFFDRSAYWLRVFKDIEAEGRLNARLPPNSDLQANGRFGRDARVGHMAGFRVERPLEWQLLWIGDG
jgi:hypothetical protein